MEKIRQAVERARGPTGLDVEPLPQLGLPPTQPEQGVVTNDKAFAEIALNSAYLEAHRIISHDITDQRAKTFDMLRTQVLQTMDLKNWQLLAITSPNPGCGKTVTAINLALSIARQPERSVLLIDMDFQNPHVAKSLGIKADQGLIGVLEGRTKLSNAILEGRIRNEKMAIFPCEASTLRSSALMASRSMSALLQQIKREFRGSTVILDLPPLLTSDDVITILPQVDCALFVVASGLSTVAEIKECNKHLDTTPVVRVVLNKAPVSAKEHYYRYGNN